MNKNRNSREKLSAANIDLSSDDLEPVELLADDFMLRKRAGEKPTIDEYCTRHPELAEEIRDVFPALVVMEQVAPATGDLDASDRLFTSPDAKPIESIGDYRVLREIGRGGMGVVYEAEQESLGRRVALKLLPRHIAKDEKALLRFQREARAAARLHHTNIVPVFEVGHDNEYSFYAMQLIKGQGLDHVIDDLRDLRSQHVKPERKGDLASGKFERQTGHRIAHSLITGHFDAERLQEKNMSSKSEPVPQVNNDPALIETIVQRTGSTVSASLPGQGELSTAEDNRRAYFHSVAEIGLQSAQAIAYAHARGITHRDIKPSNLILDTAGVVWITDFGLASTGDSTMTQTGDILGTIRYMSPERFKGQCDTRADIYSLGLTLYELLVLQPAFESADRIKLIDIVTKAELTAPRSIDSRVPRDLETIVLKACDKDPKRRYQSADAMAADLQRFLSDEPILARRASPAERIARWSRRNPWLATAVSVSAAALIAITGISVVAAQTQTVLNDQLKVANNEQKKANDALTASNKTKEQLIKDLMRSQARLAEKQAQLVAEQDDVAESMLWLSRAYELADDDDSETRQRLLSKLTQASLRMPGLVNEQQVDAAQDEYALVPYVYGVRNPEDDAEPEILRGFLKRGMGRMIFGRQSMSAGFGNLLALQSGHVDSDGAPQTLYRCYDLRTGLWSGKTLVNDGIHQASAIDERNRWLATVTYTATPNVPITKEEDSGAIHATVERLTEVRHIDTGEVIWEQRDRIDSAGNSNFIPHVMQELQTRISFSPDSKSLLRCSVQKGKPGQLDVERIEITTGEVSYRSMDLTSFTSLFVERLEISQDGKRLLVIGMRPTAFARNTMLQTDTLVLDFESGEPIGQPIRVDDSLPLYFSGSSQRVAVIRKDGNRRRIQVYDWTTGKQIGESYELNVASDTKVALCAVSPDGSRIAISCVPALDELPQELEADEASVHGWVQIIDLETNSAQTPHLPTFGEATGVVITEDERVVVRDAHQLRTWQIGGGKIDRSMFIAHSIPLPFVNLALPIIQPTSDGELLTTARFGLTRETDECEVTKWNPKSSRKTAALKVQAPKHRALAFDRSGKFLLTGVGKASRANTQLSFFTEDEFEIQSWALDTQAPVGPPVQLPAEHVAVALASDGRHVAVVIQPNTAAIPLRPDPYKIQIRNLVTGATRELVMPPGRFQPLFVDFDATGQRLLVISGPKTTLDTFNLSGANIALLKTNELRGFAVGQPRMGSVTFGNGSWAISGDGSRVAGYRTDGALQVIMAEKGTILHSISLPTQTDSMFRSQLSTSFAADGKSIYFARPGGVVFQSEITELWSGTTKQVDDRVRSSIGMQLQDDSVAFASLSDKGLSPGSTQRSMPTLEHREWQAIQHVFDEKWTAAEAELEGWTQRRPEDPLPLPLLMLCYVEQSRFEEANNTLKSFVQKVDATTAAEWLRRFADARVPVTASAGSNAVFKEQTPEELERAKWLRARRLEHTHGLDRVPALLEWARNLESQYDLEAAIEALDEVVALNPDSVEAHRHRFRILERLGKWQAAIESHRANVRLNPDDLFSHYYLSNALLHIGDLDGFKAAWQAFRDRNPGNFEEEGGNVSRVLRQRSLLGKPMLILGEQDSEPFRLALKFVDANYDSEAGMQSRLAAWYVMAKGLAEYRRGSRDHLIEAIRLLEVEFPKYVAKQPERFLPAEAFSRFVLAMAQHKLGNHSAAETAYLDGLDWHLRTRDTIQTSNRLPANDWQLAEVIRREAEELLQIDLDKIDPLIEDTSNWQVVWEENFDEGIDQDWNQLAGEWSVENGAACGTLGAIAGDYPSFGRLERKIPGTPSVFEVQYETWVSAPMVSACFLRQPPKQSLLGLFNQLTESADQDPIGLRVALASGPDRLLTRQGKPDKGINLLTHAPIGYWVNKSVPDFGVEVGKHYNVRILRQRQRITVFINGEQVLSERVRNIETSNLRFFARGEEGSKVFIDNVRVKAPSSK